MANRTNEVAQSELRGACNSYSAIGSAIVIMLYVVGQKLISPLCSFQRFARLVHLLLLLGTAQVDPDERTGFCAFASLSWRRIDFHPIAATFTLSCSLLLSDTIAIFLVLETESRQIGAVEIFH